MELRFALLTAPLMGQATCEAGDPLFGYYEQDADDGYIPTIEERTSRFLYFAVLLVAPGIVGVLNARAHAAHPSAPRTSQFAGSLIEGEDGSQRSPGGG